MDYDLYLYYNVDMDLNINNDTRKTNDHFFANIMHETDEAIENAGNGEAERTRVGFIQLLRYNQVLAREYGVNMTDNPDVAMQPGREALMELDYMFITRETVDEVGAPYNPNILILDQFGISAAWRNKGIGEQALKGFMKQMKGKYGYMLIINPKPAQLEEHEVIKRFYKEQGIEMDDLENKPAKAQMKLNAFFQRCGFRLFKNYDNIFICNIDQAVPMRMKHND